MPKIYFDDENCQFAIIITSTMCRKFWSTHMCTVHVVCSRGISSSGNREALPTGGWEPEGVSHVGRGAWFR